MPEKRMEVHHQVPRRLLAAHDRMHSRQQLDGDALQEWFDYEELLFEFGLDPDISREELKRKIDDSAVWVTYEEHRSGIHGQEWRRWGRIGGLRVLELYGATYFRHLARLRWNRITARDLVSIRERLYRARQSTA